MNQGANPSQTYGVGMFEDCMVSLVQGAIALGDRPLMNALIDKGADPNETTEKGVPLHTVVEIASGISHCPGAPKREEYLGWKDKGTFEFFKDFADDLIAKGARVDENVRFHGTPFAKAVKGNNFPFARYLLSKGADPNAEVDVFTYENNPQGGDFVKKKGGAFHGGMYDEEFAKELFREKGLQFQPWMKKDFTLNNAHAAVQREQRVESTRRCFANFCRHFTREERL